SSFGDGKKEYVLLFVPTHMSILDRARIDDLHWKSLQTRILTNGYKMKAQKWDIPRGGHVPMFSIVHRNEERSKYAMDGDINNEVDMVIKHDPKKKSKMQYHNKMNIIASLGTFKCIIVLNEQLMSRQPTGYPMGKPPVAQRYVPPSGLVEEEEEETSYLPRNVVCDNKYCYYQNSDGTKEIISSPIQGYKPMSISYGTSDISEQNEMPSNIQGNYSNLGSNDDFELL
ncbi:MAG TPA: hypothetical protein PKD85_03835, partial [Saprospiraceae bacterium]|nr:hypothetical protein [Saprospiraceae bacterium]